ncbi:MAG: ROK family transcriptional regulator [Sedimentisphaerales bacterium]|nr:ROK family transcriptional regulator [Sedimentisphaerales bacterium]
MSETPTALDSKTAGLRNEKLVLSVLATKGPLSQRQLCQLTGLSNSTASYIVARLREKQFIIEQVGQSNRRGAKPILISINAKGRYIAGVEIDASKLRLGLYDFKCQLVEYFEVEIGPNRDAESVCDLLEINVRGLLGKFGISESELLGIGVTLSGSLVPTGMIRLSSPLGWKQVPLGQMLQKRFSTAVSIHSTRVRLLAETGPDQPNLPNNMLYLNVGSGVGGHVIVDGHLIQGDTGRSGELGHVVVEPQGPLCGCGLRGCLEAFISGPALAQRIQDAIQSGQETALTQTISPDDIPEKVINAWGQALTQSDPFALQLADFVAQHLGRVAAIAINMFDPSVVLLGGYVTEQCCPQLIHAIQQRLNTEIYDGADRKMTIKQAKAGKHALIRGAAVAILRSYLEIG